MAVRTVLVLLLFFLTNLNKYFKNKSTQSCHPFVKRRIRAIKDIIVLKNVESKSMQKYTQFDLGTRIINLQFLL